MDPEQLIQLGALLGAAALSYFSGKKVERARSLRPTEMMERAATEAAPADRSGSYEMPGPPVLVEPRLAETLSEFLRNNSGNRLATVRDVEKVTDKLTVISNRVDIHERRLDVHEERIGDSGNGAWSNGHD